jgi:hypothetical protein
VNPPRRLRIPQQGGIMHVDHEHHIGWRRWALRSGLTLAWLAMLLLLAAAAAAGVIATYRSSAR